MRTRVAVLAILLCTFGAVAGPAASAPHHNRGLTIGVTPNPIQSGDGVLIYGALKGSGSAHQTIYLYHRVNPEAHFSLIQTTRTDAFGFYEFTRPDGIVTTNRSWFVRGPAATHSRTVHERVAALITLSATPTTAITGQPVVFTGTVSPTHRFQRVRLQEQDALAGNGWRTIATGFTDGSSSFSIPHRWAVAGLHTLRAVFGPDPRNIAGESDQVTITIDQRQSPEFTINPSTQLVPVGQSLSITGNLYLPHSTTPEPATAVTLYGHTADTGWQAIAAAVTGTDGSYKFDNLSPVHNTVYRVRTTLAPVRQSASVWVGVQDAVTLNSSASTSTVGGSVTFGGTVTPDHTGHIIYLQRLDADGNWHGVAVGVVGTGSQLQFHWTFGRDGAHQFRARIYGGPENVGNASAPVTVTVSGISPVTSLPPAS